MSQAPELPAVPFIDLAPQHNPPLRDDLLAAVVEVADSNAFIHGEAVQRFEASFADYCGSAHAIGLSSGTDALLAALMALGVGPGDEVVTTPFTFVATADVVLRLGARPVFVDIDPATLLIHPEAIRAGLTDRTKVVLPVHLFGHACDMERIVELAIAHDLTVLEDCAQATGSRLEGKHVGTHGQLGAFSFFPTKNLGGWGDGGMLLCDDDGMASEIRAIRDHGSIDRTGYTRVGGNFRLDTLQAAVLEVKLSHLPAWIEHRKKAASRYDELLAGSGLASGPRAAIRPPAPADPGAHSWGLYVIRARERDALRDHLARDRISTGVYYTRPLHLQPVLADLGHAPGDFPVAEEAAASVLALPLFPGIADAQQERVVESIAAFFRTRNA